MKTPLRIALTACLYLLSLVVVAAIVFVVVIVLAGPHAGIFPAAIEVVVLALGWMAVLVAPALAGWKVWQRLGRSRVG